MRFRKLGGGKEVSYQEIRKAGINVKENFNKEGQANLFAIHHEHFSFLGFLSS
jgi:hypothetical protein